MKKILVTGCNGFLGRHICDRFTEKKYSVYGIDVAGTPCKGLAGYVNGPITSEAFERLGEPFDAIFHLAGPGTVNAANQNAEATSRCVQNNMLSVLEAARKHPQTLIIYPSSAGIYGDQKVSPTPEDAVPAPLSVYGQNKLNDEKLCEEYHRKYGSRICMVRFFSIYGPGLRKQLLWDFSQRLADAVKSGKSSVPCFGTGEESRDYIFIDDVVGIFEFFCMKNPDWLVVNAGTGTEHTVRQVLESLVAAYGLDVKLDFDNVIRQGNPMHLIADVRRLGGTGFVPSVPFDEGIKRYAAWAAEELAIGRTK